MANKHINIPNIGMVTFTKLRRSRSLRLSITPRGIRVSLPIWTPYTAGVHFVEQQSDWIKQQLVSRRPTSLKDGQKIGKLHTLRFEIIADNQALSSRVTPTKLLVRLYANEQVESETVQDRARAAAIRALRKETLQLLKPRLAEIAEKNGFSYTSVKAKEMKRRWGSCDTNKNIILNLYLMQLEWQEIDYVLSHELAHTMHMNHGEEFWACVTAMVPHARQIAKKVRHIQPALTPSESATALDDDMAY